MKQIRNYLLYPQLCEANACTKCGKNLKVKRYTNKKLLREMEIEAKQNTHVLSLNN